MGENERYSRIEISLAGARNDEELHIAGDYISVAACSGVTDEYIKLNHRNARPIYLNEVKEIKLTHGFNKIYFTNTAAPGFGDVVLYVGNMIYVRTED